MSKEKVHEYPNGEVAVIWKPDVCIHSGECVKGSPEVFKPNERPWIQIGNTASKELMETLDKCPSGALSYRLETVEKSEDAEVTNFRIKSTKNGPFLILGNLEIEDAEGNVELCGGTTTALCRCGASANKPFCDGSHKTIGFES